MNGIAERTNDLIVTKARCLLLDFSLSQYFWLEAFDTAVYLLNCLLSTSLDYNVSLEEFLKIYHNDYHYDYTQDLSHLRIWGCKVSTHIPDEKRVKSQKRAIPSQEDFLVGYEAQNIYKIFIKEMGKIEKLRDVKFIEDDQSLATYLADKGFFYYLDFTSKEENEPLPMEVNNLSNSNNKLSPIYSDTEIFLHYSTKIQHVPDKYGIIAQHLAMLTPL